MLLGSCATFSVRYTESAVVTTLGKATEGSDIKIGAGAVLEGPAADPDRHDVRHARAHRLLEGGAAADRRRSARSRSSVLRPGRWPIRSSSSRVSATRALAPRTTSRRHALIEANLRATSAMVSRYTHERPVHAAPRVARARFRNSRPRCSRPLRDTKDARPRRGRRLADYGVEVTSVGISRIVLPESVTSAVFEAMKQRRLTLAKETESRGEAEAATIRIDWRDAGEPHPRVRRARAQELIDAGRSRGDAVPRAR